MANAGHEVTAIELFGASHVYDWERGGRQLPYRVVTLAPDRSAVGPLALAWRIVKAVRNCGAQTAFLCHYSEPAVFGAAVALRVRGPDLVTMLDSKADDRPRNPLLAIPKRVMLAPYRGALVAGERSARYAAELGIDRHRIASHYNALDIAGLRALGGSTATTAFVERPFLVVARLVPEKNLAMALRAFASYRRTGGKRRLAIVGEGPLGPELASLARTLGLTDQIEWRGKCGRAAIMSAMRGALALLLPSTSETYGLVVVEALANGLPVVVSCRAGVVDLPLVNDREGMVIDPASDGQLLAAMQALDRDQELWQRMSCAARQAADLADTRHFLASVECLAGK